MGTATRYTAWVFTSLSARQLAELDAVAEHDGRPRTSAIRRALQAHVQRLRERGAPPAPRPQRGTYGMFPHQVAGLLTSEQLAELDEVAGTGRGGSRSKTIRDAVVAYVARYLQMNPDVVVPDVVERAKSKEVAA